MGIHPIKMTRHALRTKPRKAAAVAGVLMALGGGAAYAYIVTEGSGSASSNTGAIAAPANVSLEVDAGGSAAPTYAGPGVVVPFSIINRTSTPARVSNVNVTITGTSVAGCDPSWFTVNPGSVGPLPQVLQPQAMLDDSATPWTISFPENDTTDQSTCVGAVVNYTITAS